MLENFQLFSTTVLTIPAVAKLNLLSAPGMHFVRADSRLIVM